MSSSTHSQIVGKFRYTTTRKGKIRILKFKAEEAKWQILVFIAFFRAESVTLSDSIYRLKQILLLKPYLFIFRDNGLADLTGWVNYSGI